MKKKLALLLAVVLTVGSFSAGSALAAETAGEASTAAVETAAEEPAEEVPAEATAEPAETADEAETVAPDEETETAEEIVSEEAAEITEEEALDETEEDALVEEEALAEEEITEELTEEEELPVYEAGFVTVDGLTKYQNADGTYAVNAWVTDDKGLSYYMNASGVPSVGFQTIDGKTYFFYRSTNPAKYGADHYKGVMATGWQNIDGKTYFFLKEDRTDLNESYTRGVMVTGIYETAKNRFYCFNDKGQKQYDTFTTTKDMTVKGAASGRTITIKAGFHVLSGDYSYLIHEDINVDKNHFYWNSKAGGWAYVNDGGIASKGWIYWNNGWHYFDDKGINKKNGLVSTPAYSGTQTAPNGKSNTVTITKGNHIFNQNGVYCRNCWVNTTSGRFFADKNGKVLTGWQTINNYKYYIDAKKGAYSGLKKVDGKTYYFNPYAVNYSWKKVGKYYYHFNNSTGVMDANKTVSQIKLDKNGHATGDKNKIEMVVKANNNWTSETSYFCLVNKSTHKVGVFKGKKDNWTLIQYWTCTVGAKVNGQSLTPSGTRKLGYKVYRYEFDHSCGFYCSSLGFGFFHSILYNKSDRSPIHVSDGRLGVHGSHACVRLSLANSKWVYNNLPRNTKVHIYGV